MVYNNQFSMDKYFENNYGLPKKPAKYVFGKKSFLVLILFCWIWIPLAIIMTVKANNARKAWDEAYEYRRTNWWKEYEKAREKAIVDMKIKESAFKKLGIVEGDPDLDAVEPIFFYGPIFKGKDAYWRHSEAGDVRASKYECTYIVFKKEQILFYTNILNLCDTQKKKESTQEFFYSDITSVNISTESTTPDTAATGDKEAVEIDVEKVVLVVPGDKISMAFTPTEQGEESIKGMRNLIRERKSKA